MVVTSSKESEMSSGHKVLFMGLILLAAVIINCGYILHRNDLAFIEAGYTRQTLPGTDSTQWVLPSETEVTP